MNCSIVEPCYSNFLPQGTQHRAWYIMDIRVYLLIECVSSLSLLNALQFSSKAFGIPCGRAGVERRSAEPDLGVNGDLSGPVGLLCHWPCGSFLPAAGMRGSTWGPGWFRADLNFLNPQRAGDGLAPLGTMLTSNTPPPPGPYPRGGVG